MMHWSSVIYELCYHIYDKMLRPVIPMGLETDDGRCLRSEGIRSLKAEGVQGNGRDTMVCGDPKECVEV